ncbi:MAG: hypothetical protein RL213_1306 [Bacteroidota bacterium]|jgi:phosphoribosylglycinamide formyltransferase-1
MSVTTEYAPRVAFLCGRGGGDFVALTKARDRGLVRFETVAFFTTHRDSTALRLHSEQPSRVTPTVLENIRSDRESAFRRIGRELEAARPDLVFLCGFTFLLPPFILKGREERVINTHHATLPEHPGLFTKEQLVAAGEPELGATVHIVDEGVDTGKVLAAARFPNFGMESFDRVLRYYRFVQDVLIVQVMRDLTDRKNDGRVVEYHDIRFEPSVEIRIIESIKGDHGFA